MAEKLRLFFTVGKVPTMAERAQAAALGMTCFRNSQRVLAGQAVEAAAEVAGAVPASYAKAGIRVVKPGPTADELAAEAAAKAEAEVKAQAEADALKSKQHRR